MLRSIDVEYEVAHGLSIGTVTFDRPWMTLNRPRPRSLNFRIRYLEYHERYNVRHNGGQIGNDEWAFD